MIYFSIITLLSLTMINFFLKKGDYLYPATIYTGIWSIVLTAYAITQNVYYQIKDEVFLLIITSNLLFSIFCIVSSGLTIRNRKFTYLSSNMFIYKEISKKYHWILFLLMMIIAYKAKSIIENEDIFTAYFYLRNEINYGDGDSGYGIVKYLFTLSYFILFLSSFSFSVNSTKKYRTVFIKSFILCLSISVLSTSRTQVLTVFLSAFLPLLFFQKINIKMMISLLILIFVPLFLITGYILGKLSASSEGVKEILSSYFVAPMVAFSQISYPSSLPGNGESTFRFFYAIFEAFGSNRSASSLIQPFIYVPTPTNLYTSFLPYYTDFGTIGVLVIISILGILHGLLYRWVSSGELSLFKIFIYIVSIFPLLSVYSTETHFLQISLWIQYFVFGLIFIKICPRLKLKSSLNYEN